MKPFVVFVLGLIVGLLLAELRPRSAVQIVFWGEHPLVVDGGKVYAVSGDAQSWREFYPNLTGDYWTGR